MAVSRGFVTLACGDDHYYKLAYNLLKSFRLFNGRQARFAILCDRQNKYTLEFDDVVILNSSSGNYLDKFRLLTDSPYDENFFIEPDCLVCSDISFFWDVFANGDDFSSFGWNNGELSLWFDSADIKHKFGIYDIPIFCPGYLYVRKSPKIEKMYRDLIDVSNYILANRDIHPLCFTVSGQLRDDPIFDAAMSMNGFNCAAKPKIGGCINYPAFKKRSEGDLNAHLRMDFDKFVFEYCDSSTDYVSRRINIFHFSTKQTKKIYYKIQAQKIGKYLKLKNKAN